MSTQRPVRTRQRAGRECPRRFATRSDEFAALVRHIVENVMLNVEVTRLDGAIRMAAK
jgi:hypothetical protein